LSDNALTGGFLDDLNDLDEGAPAITSDS